MNARASLTAKLMSASTWRDALLDWSRTDGLTWIYILKAAGAALLSLGIAMKLELPQPRTAMMTVFLVMQPQSGIVLAKSFYRIAGTLVGSLVTIVLIALFAQEPTLFLLSVSVWVGICTFGAARNRNFRSYGFVLAGYTAALVGIPAAQHPDGAFIAAVTRVTEVTLGIVCAGTVSALVFPQYTGDTLRTVVRARYARFAKFVADTLAGRADRAGAEQTHTHFVADVVGLEALRSFAVFEDPRTRMRSGRLSRLNTEFMNASTRFHSLHQLMNRIRANGQHEVIDAIAPYLREVSPLLLKKNGEPVRNAADAEHAAAQLQAFKESLPRRIGETRTALESHTRVALLDFDTAAEMLYRFVADMHTYALTYASLSADLHERERTEARYVPRTNTTAAGVAGLRATLVMLALAAFWISTAWTSGGTAVLNAAPTCALVASMPQPAKTASQMAGGTVFAAVAGFIAMFFVYPRIDGYVMLCAALVPFLLVGMLIATRPGWAGYGIGYCLFFSFLAGPDNFIHYDPSSFINDAIALIVSMLVTAVACAVLLPPASPWQRNRLLRSLLRQVAAACTERLGRARRSLESGTRDLMHQANALTTDRPDVQAQMLGWMFTVLEVGHAAIDLRTELANLPDNACYAPSAAWRREIQRMLEALAALFGTPTRERLVASREATSTSIDAALQMLDAAATPREDRHQLQRTLSYLHFIRTALLDPRSPLNISMPGMPASHPKGANTAA
ncbi:FUSC family protein [Paraburkholderia elongata]|uniref:FUSC family protein n=1 Tax=Paraburkholderia elongata TaxID=2675747 RepID=A0A972NY05_9BURK|nr:FUSC family protein [Paraburkholderia elongata]NPT61866.1 FUSC family protein [Paraburkholderia elongata]